MIITIRADGAAAAARSHTAADHAQCYMRLEDHAERGTYYTPQYWRHYKHCARAGRVKGSGDWTLITS